MSSGSAQAESDNSAVHCRYLLNADSVVLFESVATDIPENTERTPTNTAAVSTSSGRGFAGYDDEYQQCLGYIRLGLAVNVADQQRSSLLPHTPSSAELFRPPRGLLLHGPAGTGKSRMMRSLVRAVGCRSVEVSHGILLSG